MRSGSGAMHEEMWETSADRSTKIELFQLWVNLPACLKMRPPAIRYLGAAWGNAVPPCQYKHAVYRAGAEAWRASRQHVCCLLTPPPLLTAHSRFPLRGGDVLRPWQRRCHARADRERRAGGGRRGTGSGVGSQAPSADPVRHAAGERLVGDCCGEGAHGGVLRAARGGAGGRRRRRRRRRRRPGSASWEHVQVHPPLSSSHTWTAD
jgi:hypothetical protein